ncbi:DUF2065 domain-containing protein [Antarcticimicrobium sediminis]|uniref:DUF2065 domain-containing protein n=1 Tax=Antarcticimicrobium sediminis TaxID=2546227 RepID=A0A4R5F1G9_9RHOB|nr:DUF2065 domain-containing protein [Antarcticimicrobium sediminis]TDE41243.1 DUF2065 domain-containing protein [Antarcticimicrobium sediminis]
MANVILALGLVLIVEGLAWWLAPSLIEQLLEMLRALPVPARRQIGALALVAGLILLWIAHQLGAGQAAF